MIDTSVSMKGNFQLIKDNLALLFQVIMSCEMFPLSDNYHVTNGVYIRMYMNINNVYYVLAVTSCDSACSCINVND